MSVDLRIGFKVPSFPALVLGEECAVPYVRSGDGKIEQYADPWTAPWVTTIHRIFAEVGLTEDKAVPSRLRNAPEGMRRWLDPRTRWTADGVKVTLELVPDWPRVLVSGRARLAMRARLGERLPVLRVDDVKHLLEANDWGKVCHGIGAVGLGWLFELNDLVRELQWKDDPVGQFATLVYSELLSKIAHDAKRPPP